MYLCCTFHWFHTSSLSVESRTEQRVVPKAHNLLQVILTRDRFSMFEFNCVSVHKYLFKGLKTTMEDRKQYVKYFCWILWPYVAAPVQLTHAHILGMSLQWIITGLQLAKWESQKSSDLAHYHYEKMYSTWDLKCPLHTTENRHNDLSDEIPGFPFLFTRLFSHDKLIIRRKNRYSTLKFSSSLCAQKAFLNIIRIRIPVEVYCKPINCCYPLCQLPSFFCDSLVNVYWVVYGIP